MNYNARTLQVIKLIKKQKHIRFFLGLSLLLILSAVSSQQIALIFLFALPVYLALKRYEIIHRKNFTVQSALEGKTKKVIIFDFYYLLTAFIPLTIYISNLFIAQKNINNLLVIAASFFSIILLSEFIAVFMIRVIRDKEINYQETSYEIIVGSISIYMLFGLLCFFMYLIIFLIDKNAFYNVNLKKIEQPFDLLYFSLKTLTTVGYGDIVPVSFGAKIISNFEAIIGVMFPAVFIARLVAKLK